MSTGETPDGTTIAYEPPCFMTDALGLPPDILPAMQAGAMWATMEHEAHTLASDALAPVLVEFYRR